MSRVCLIAGAGGMLGTALQRVLAERGQRFVAPPEACFDITAAAAVRAQVAAFVRGLAGEERGFLLNAAAYTDVERAEDDPEAAYRVNRDGARILAEAARDAGLGFVHVSTDFVFDGSKDGAYVETDAPHPLSVYGASKLAGELAVSEADGDALIVRTAWVFGPAGANFAVKILAAARERGALTVVDDQIGSPTYTIDLARGILGLIDAGAAPGILGLLDAGAAPGIYHLAGSGVTSRYDMALEVLRLAGAAIPISRAKSTDFPTKAARPLNSALDCSKAAALGVLMPEWKDALGRYLAETGEIRTQGAGETHP